MAINLTLYKKIKKRDLLEFDSVDIKVFIPTPKDSDYDRGYLTRYFVQKVNDVDSTIYEISEFTFNNLSMNSFYFTTKLNWRLNGTNEQIKDSNFKSVKLASKDMPKLMMYLPNYLQFSK